MARIRQWTRGNFRSFTSYSMNADRTALTNPPINPIHVFFGDTDGKSFFGKRLPSDNPKEKAPTSAHQIMMKKQSSKSPLKLPALSKAIRLLRAIGTAIYRSPV